MELRRVRLLQSLFTYPALGPWSGLNSLHPMFPTFRSLYHIGRVGLGVTHPAPNKSEGIVQTTHRICLAG